MSLRNTKAQSPTHLVLASNKEAPPRIRGCSCCPFALALAFATFKGGLGLCTPEVEEEDAEGMFDLTSCSKVIKDVSSS